MEIETLAVSQIASMIARCPRLQPIINSNDKTPFTDGHIEMYSAPGKKKADWLGRVAVQVKGRTAGKRKSPPSHSVDRSELVAFQREGGVLYFYVTVDPKGVTCPYYSVLTPYTIEHHVQGMKRAQKTAAIRLTKFPHLPEEIERIVELALRGKRQQPTLGVDPALFEKAETITVFAASDLDFDAPLRLAHGETDFALEIRTTDGASVPIGGTLQIWPEDYLERKTELSVAAGGAAYENVVVRRLDAESVEIKLDEGLSLTLRDGSTNRQCNVNITTQSNFVTLKRALEFVIGLADSRQIEVNGQPMLLEKMATGKSARLQEMRDQLASLRDVQELFDRLGVDAGYVDLEELNEQHWRHLRDLHRVLVQGAAPSNPTGNPSRALVEIGPWAVMLFVSSDQEVPGAWRCIDPFDPESPQILRWSADGDPGETIPVTPYDTLEVEDLRKILNLRLDSIVNAYVAISEFEQTNALANQCMLGLIKVADSCAPRRDEFLRGAESLNEWLIRKEGEQPIHLVNRYQIRWRNGTLAGADRATIRTLKYDAHKQIDNGLETELACALLLGDTEEATYLISKLSSEQRQKMETWPIWHLQHLAESPPGSTSSTD